MKLNDFKLSCLAAYPYMSPPTVDMLNRNKDNLRFLLDSGAFTAWKAGKPIALDDYCKFLDTLPFKPWRYFTLDVIGDPKNTLKNYQTMLDRGYKPVPIFTRGEDISVLEDYYKTSDVVGIGGLVGTPKNKGFINGIMKYVGKRKVHWLGFTNFEYIKYYKPYMCDSSSWLTGSRYASFKLYLGHGKFAKLAKKFFIDTPNFINGEERRIFDRIAQLGFDKFELTKNTGWIGGKSLVRNLCAASYVCLSLDIEKNLKTYLFQAASNKQDLEMLVNNFNNVKGMYTK